MDCAGLIFDDSRHYLDHLGPYCALNGWPLIACEGTVADLARRYYPSLEVIETNVWDLSLPDLIVSCDLRGLLKSAFGPNFKSNLLWLPHGNSDKGWNTSFFAPLQGESALVYGQKMVDFMKMQNVFPNLKRVGNFRLAYWRKHQKHYDALIEKEIRLKKRGGTYLYAPTWSDAEDNGSFWRVFPTLAANVPDHCNLIVKLHPNTLLKSPIEIEILMSRYVTKSNIIFLPEFPPIYPLLNLCDAYIGDMSSIGYDFLYWNRPMYFINERKKNASRERSLFLYRCGHEIFPEETAAIFQKRDEPDCLRNARRQVYAYTFDTFGDNLSDIS